MSKAEVQCCKKRETLACKYVCALSKVRRAFTDIKKVYETIHMDAANEEVSKMAELLELRTTNIGQRNEACDMNYIACLKTASELMADWHACVARGP